MLTVFVESASRGDKFRVAAHLAGVPLRVEVVPVAEAARHPAVMASPLQQLPVLATPAGPLCRTFAILRYLAQLREDAGLRAAAGEGALFAEASADGFVEWSASALEPAAVLFSSQAADFAGAAPAMAVAARVAGSTEGVMVRVAWGKVVAAKTEAEAATTARGAAARARGAAARAKVVVAAPGKLRLGPGSLCGSLPRSRQCLPRRRHSDVRSH